MNRDFFIFFPHNLAALNECQSANCCFSFLLFFFFFFRFEWDKLLENVHCLIISVTKSDKQEAYILR